MCRTIKLTSFGFVLGVLVVVAAQSCTVQPQPCLSSVISVTTLGCTR